MPFHFFQFLFAKKTESGILRIRRCPTNTEKCKRILFCVDRFRRPIGSDQRNGKQQPERAVDTPDQRSRKIGNAKSLAAEGCDMKEAKTLWICESEDG